MAMAEKHRRNGKGVVDCIKKHVTLKYKKIRIWIKEVQLFFEALFERKIKSSSLEPLFYSTTCHIYGNQTLN